MLPNLTQQFNIGNIVSLASYLYRSNFKRFSRLSLFAHLWLIVPIYGWAKFYAFAGLISRLAFSEINGEPESSKVAKIQIKKRFWQFLITAILVILICLLQFFLFYIAISIIAGIIYGILATVFGAISQPINKANPFENTIFRIIIIPIAIAIYSSPLWFYSRFFITDLPLAIEDDTNSIGAIKRSRQLSKGLTWRIIAIILVSFVITLPIQILGWLIYSIGFNILIRLISLFLSGTWANENKMFISILPLMISILINGTILMPFWQSIKSVVYYDIICCREGFDLKIRDRTIELTSDWNK
ncbi:hypothetical protein NIES4072_01570 [Nostoc commune NIES-4072]|uniref:Uncharacterized protein n=1 Tax=Nostoc commune NIES-4072 TaxID=2005467 RepID=A0A2R5FL46_NOSCO|nr:hypothetical protein [Nostoc commune]BBD66164.1 hypothetical protein NIES4070_25250 [Nostoc commune HK-02]GBG16511.1 hypothetical protein NIES4072_01570 [Nostoc commune NIES-4072]